MITIQTKVFGIDSMYYADDMHCEMSEYLKVKGTYMNVLETESSDGSMFEWTILYFDMRRRNGLSEYICAYWGARNRAAGRRMIKDVLAQIKVTPKFIIA